MTTRRLVPRVILALAILGNLPQRASAESLDLAAARASTVRITAISAAIFRLSVRAAGKPDPIDSIYLDPALKLEDLGKASGSGGHRLLTTSAGVLDVDVARGTYSLRDSAGKELIPPAPFTSGAPDADVKIGWPSDRPFEVYGSGNGSNELVQKNIMSRVGNGVAVVPYFWSKSGFAAFAIGAEEDHPPTCNGKVTDGAVTWAVQGRSADLYLMIAPTLADATKLYLTLTGRPPVPPKWALGYLQSRWGWKDKAYIDDVLVQFQTRKFPVDAFIFDFEWYTTYPDYGVKPEGAEGFSDFGWNKDLFPDPASQVKQLHDAGVKFIGIRKPRLGDRSTLADVREKGWGFNAPQDKGDKFDARGLRFSNAKARAWYADQIKPLLQAGVDGWWNDEGEFSYTNYSYWNQAEAQALASVDPKARLWTINRAFQPGTSRYGAAAWTGDIRARWEDLARTPASLLNWSLAGMPECGCDIGGFSGQDTPELLVRWMQAGTFFPVMRCHSDHDNTPHFPWLFGTDAEAAMHKALEQRYMLVPYLYSLAHETHDSGLPMMRPLAMAYPGDPKVANLTSEWLVGEGLLVAPILTRENHRKVYLPEGTWYEADHHEPIAGGTELDRDVPLDKTPLFVRAGTIITAASKGALHTRDLAAEPLQLYVFPGKDATFTLVEDDGATTDYLSGKVRRTTFTWTDATRTLTWTRAGNYDGDDCFRELQILPMDVDVVGKAQPLTASGSAECPK